MISCYFVVTNFLYHLCKEKCRCGYLLGGQFNESGGGFSVASVAHSSEDHQLAHLSFSY